MVEVFDRIYTYPLLRWRAFLRSLLLTTIISAIWIFETYILHLNFLGVHRLLLFLAFVNVLMFWVFNIFTDYLSLFVIRRVLSRSGTKAVIGLALGAMSGFAIVFVANSPRWPLQLLLWEHIFLQNPQGTYENLPPHVSTTLTGMSASCGLRL